MEVIDHLPESVIDRVSHAVIDSAAAGDQLDAEIAEIEREAQTLPTRWPVISDRIRLLHRPGFEVVSAPMGTFSASSPAPWMRCAHPPRCG